MTPLREAADLVRELPANVEAEQALLGSLLCRNSIYAEVAGRLRAEQFTVAVHGRIFAAIAELIAHGAIANPITLYSRLEQDPALQVHGGGSRYLARLAESTPTLLNAKYYAAEIVEVARRRQLTLAGEQLIESALSGEKNTEELIERHRDSLFEIADIGNSDSQQLIVDPVDLQDLPVPERQRLVPEWVPRFSVTIMSGAGGVGKSLAAQQLLTSAAIGAPWLGLPVARVRSIYYACEDAADELHRRQSDINAAYGCDFADLNDVRWLPRLGRDNLLMTFPGGIPTLSAGFAELLREARQFGAKLIGIDTIADTFGGNENDRGQVRQFVQACLGRLASEIGGAVLALAHPSRSGQADGTGQSGSTGWDASVRSRLYLSSPEARLAQPSDPDLRELARKKANYARRDDRTELRWKNGVLVPTGKPSFGIFAAPDRQRAERVFLDLLDRTLSEGQYVSHNPRAGNYAPRLFALRPERERLGKPDFEQAMQRLFGRGQIAVGERKGADRKLYEIIIRAEK